jgi:acetyl-CoA C-acetyltransferase
VDGIIRDGLWDAADNHHMGSAAEVCAVNQEITREQQDAFAIESYRRAAEATMDGRFKEEIVPVEIKTRKGVTVFSEDEEFSRVNPERVPTLKPVFKKDGTVTAANASSLNDGASALIVASEEFVAKRKLTPVATVLGFADTAMAPVDFTICPSKCIPVALERAGLALEDIDLFEINEAFAVVSLANNKLLNLDPEKVNVNGGAVALGHPIGASGARIVTTLIHALKQRGLKRGVAAICNGGGGSSAVVIEVTDH